MTMYAKNQQYICMCCDASDLLPLKYGACCTKQVTDGHSGKLTFQTPS